MKAPPKSVVLFAKLWPQNHTAHAIWEALHQEADDVSVLTWDETETETDKDKDAHNETDTRLLVSPEANVRDCNSNRNINSNSSGDEIDSDESKTDTDTNSEASVDCFLDKVIHTFELLERRVSWGRRGKPNIEAALFCYCAFGSGRRSFQKTTEEYADFDKAQLLPSYELLNGIASAVHVDPLSVSMIQFALWHLIGFQKTQLDNMLQESGSLLVRGPLNRTSRSLSLSEFEQGTMYEQLEAYEEKCCIFVSHRWQTSLHPDPDNEQTKQVVIIAKNVQACLNAILHPSTTEEIAPQKQLHQPVMEMDPRLFSFSKTIVRDEVRFAIEFFVHGQHQVRLWYDYYSIPQGTDDASRALRTKCLEEITGLCQSMIFLGLISDDYFTRGWCAFELIQHTGSATKRGTKLCTNDPEAHHDSPNDAVHAFLSQTYVDFHSRSIHGRLCGLLEDRSHVDETAVLLNDLGIRCTNGSDLLFVSRVLVTQIQEAPKQEELLTWIHPFVSAMGRLLEESLVPPVVSTKRQRRCRSELCPKYAPKALTQLCFKWRNELRTCGSEETAEVVAAKVVFKWRYPEDCLDHLLETRVDFEGIPDYCAQLQQSIELLDELRVALRTHSVSETWEACKRSLESTLLSRLDSLLATPGHFVLVNFSGK